ncbi:delta endotoxin C-terminal domain-containing protein [Bacillus thuringiensis]|uniref:delta endotoxin C-terminal domain-containing protein n=1 Tax=Bacillus thuringiensis TaxID=1428 RepID=UPI0018CD9911|nr:delta endotoxin C-terminal domain-containing protein [Bacillus thuringiensis]EKS8373612.1 pesticidal protein [Bacillus cereus]MBG9515601.1 pesticidal protein [Bacillus thuringiensis]MED3390727.1 delta endotoxin C-terminal domain-containing protein [Bacillus thuringiensis]
MATLNNMFSVPYNVLALPIIPNSILTFEDNRKKIEEGIKEFEKTGRIKPLKDLIELILKGYSDDESSYAALVQTMLVVIPLAFPELAPVIPIIGVVINLVFPGLKGSAKSTYTMITEMVDKAINQSFTAQITNILTNDITGIQNNIQSVYDAMSNAIGTNDTIHNLIRNDDTTPCSQNNQPACPCPPNNHCLQKVVDEYNTAIANIDLIIPQFHDPLTGVISDLATANMYILPLYAQTVNLKLILRQSFIEFMEKYKYDEKETVFQAFINADIPEQIKKLRQDIIMYTKDIYMQFEAHAPYPTYNSKKQLNDYIRYTRIIQVYCLDLVAMWPTLDRVNYALPVQQNMTRIIFGDLIGPVETVPQVPRQNSDNFHFNLSDVYRNPLPNNDIANYRYGGLQISKAQFMTYYKKFGAFSTHDEYYYVDGHRLSFNTSDKKTIEINAHQNSHDTIEKDVIDQLGGYITRMNMVSQEIGSGSILGGNAIDRTALTTSTGDKDILAAGFNAINNGNYKTEGRGASHNHDVPNHKVQAIYPVQPDKYEYDEYGSEEKYGYLYTLIPMDVSFIPQLNAEDVITTIPAEQAVKINGQSVIDTVNTNSSLEFVNGANAIKLSPGETAQYTMINPVNRSYQVRVRVATEGETQLDIIAPVDRNTLNLSNTKTTANDQNGILGKQGNYIVFPQPNIDTVTGTSLPPTENIMNFPVGTFDFTIVNSGNSDTILDRIEFVPIVTSNKIQQDFTISPGTSQVIWTGNSANTIDITIIDNVDTSGLFVQIFQKGKQLHGELTLIDPAHIQRTFSEQFDQIVLYNPGYNSSISGTVSGSVSSIPKKFELSSDLQNITNQVNNLFASSEHDTLATDVSDYDIEEVVLKVDALSDEVFGKVKKELRKLVNQAKRLSKARNLLVGGSFDNLDAWYRGRNVVTVSDHELFKSDHILLPLPTTLYPSYLFQKVEESKLKANTRYTVSGFIAHAEDLEIVVSRYGQEIKKVVQVPYGESFPLTSSGPVCCVPRSTRNGTPADPHFFSYSIDVGALDMAVGPGIEFGLRIVEPTGMARVSNLEIREDRPLTANEIRKVQRAARDWKQKYDQERAEVTALIQPVLNQINALYENENWNGSIRSDISYHDIESIVLPTLPKLNHWFMSDMLGEQGSILAQFQEALDRAYTQLEGNTLLHNGHFTTDAANWTVEGDAHQVVLEDGRRVLRLPDWSSSVSQTIEIENFDPDKEYQLVFHAQGEGTVSLQHGEEGEYVETHPHKFANFTTSHRQGITFETNKVTVEIASEDGEFLVDHIALVEAPLPTDDQSSDGNTTSNTNSNTSMNNNQ